MAVEHALGPCRDDQQPDHGEHDPNRRDRQWVPIYRRLAGGDPRGVAQQASVEDGHHPRRGRDADQDDAKNRHDEQPEDGAREPPGIVAPSFAQQPTQYWNEGGRHRLVAEQILHQVGQAQRNVKGVLVRPCAEEPGKCLAPGKAREAAQQNAECDPPCPAWPRTHARCPVSRQRLGQSLAARGPRANLG